MSMFDPTRVQLAIMPTCWVNDDFPLVGQGTSYQQIMSETALAGFSGGSISHTYPTDPALLREQLELRGLRISEPWVSLYFTVADMADPTVEAFRRQVDLITGLGGDRIVVAEFGQSVHLMPDVALMPNRPQFDDDRWRRLTDGVNELGKIAQEAGLKLCYHHHMGTGVQSRADVDRFLAHTDPSLVHLALDTGHLTWAGDDVMDLARSHVDRIGHVHLKSVRREIIERAVAQRWSFFRGVMEGAFAVPGDGDLDFRPLLQLLSDHGYQGWLSVEAEQDPTRHEPLAQAKRARAYLREIIGW